MRTPTGTITSVATELAPAVAITVLTNAVEAVATAAGHGCSVGDIVVVFSGWGRINYKAFQVKAVAGDLVTLKKCNTNDQTLFAPGGGVGTLRRVVPAKWVDLDRTMGHTSNGGDAKTINVKFTEYENEFVLNDGFTAVTRSFEMDADLIGTPGYEAMVLLSQTQQPTVVRRRAKTGAFTLIPGTVSFNEEEIEAEGQIVRVKGTINGQNSSTRYAAT
ncbi:MAG: phage tail protein [Variovorax paradoxus]|nr:MAG: phage tail protein [Variovorax paradoxus]PZQ08942.1 MAG: phage tail protein [Variovorax paradoxus]